MKTKAVADRERAGAVTAAPFAGDLATTANSPDTRLFGLVQRKQVWRLSWRGWLLALVLVGAVGAFLFLNVFAFLATNQPVRSDMLVVEGWVHNYAMPVVVEEFRRGGYREVFSTGGPVPGTGGYTNDFNTSASVGAERLIALGLPREVVHTVASRETERNRTYGSAVALKRRLKDRGMDVRAVNVMTESTHARRTLILFQEALGPEIKVGVIPIFNPDYNPEHWWHYSEGVREVIGEALAYVYVKLFFSPP
jgi:uncharacterized SAM-binding protein YcdF (DUF218 family)